MKISETELKLLIAVQEAHAELDTALTHQYAPNPWMQVEAAFIILDRAQALAVTAFRQENKEEIL